MKKANTSKESLSIIVYTLLLYLTTVLMVWNGSTKIWYIVHFSSLKRSNSKNSRVSDLRCNSCNFIHAEKIAGSAFSKPKEREAFRTLKFLSRETCRQPAVFHMHDLLDHSAASEKAIQTTLQHIIMAWPIGVHSRSKHQTAAVVVGPTVVISPNFWCKSGESRYVSLLHTCSPAVYDSSQLRNCHYF